MGDSKPTSARAGQDMNRRDRISRVAFYAASTSVLCFSIFLAGVYSGATKGLPYKVLQRVKSQAELFTSEFSNVAGTKPTHWVVERRYPGEGVTVNRLENASSELVLLQGFFEDGLALRLIRRDGTPIARWPISFKSLATDIRHLRNRPATDWNVGLHGAILLPDGSVMLNLEFIALVKLDRCGSVEWILDRPAHHSIEPNSDGSFWLPVSTGVESVTTSGFELFKAPYAADSLLRISATGTVLEEIALLDVFIRSDALALLTLTGQAGPGTMGTERLDFKREIFHLNDVEELPVALAAGFPMFEPGDLLVSLRNRNLVMVVDRSTQTIKWWQIGPWVRQHDPDWSADGTISVFDNNRDGTGTGKVLGGSRLIIIDPATRETRVRYGEADDEFFYTERRGKHQLLTNGHTLIVEAEAGRVFEIDQERQVVWEYVNGYSDTENVRIVDARVYPAGYLNAEYSTCPY